ncbi:MAG: GTP-binding protein [Chloroflexi bacterium]|nr:GTP-binding protein [Chloroflexota bacterium]
MANTPVYKVAFVGDGNVGKTTLIRKYSTGHFQASRVMTIGVDLTTHLISLAEDRQVKLTVWDMSGQDRFASVRAPFYRGSRVVILAYDVTSPESLAHLPKWLREVRSFLPTCPIILVGNKIDLERRVKYESGRAFSTMFSSPYYETSCVTGEGVETLFAAIANLAASR